MSNQTADQILEDATRRGLRRILVVTAIPLEMRSVRAHLQAVGDMTLRNHQIVELGIFSSDGEECLVVVAASRAGNHEAQATVTYAALQCGPIDMIVFVGVAGSRKDDVPIGSVVASTEVYLPYSGKYEGGEFKARPASFQADRVLVELASKVERDGFWVDRITAPLRGSLPSMDAYPQPHPPGAFVAPIVSVEAVSADVKSQLEIQISKHCGDAHAVEMEGYGALFAAREEGTAAIVIRGISDAREGKDPLKDAIYQPVAAAHAAAFAFELIALRMKRYPTTSLAGRGELPAIAAPPARLPAPDASSPRIDVAFSFAGTEADFPPEKCEGMAQSLREYLGDDSVALKRTESGSFHMIFSLRPDDLVRAREPGLAALLATRFGAPPTSIIEEDVFVASRRARAILADSSRELLDWNRTLPDGTEMVRPELQTLLTKVEGAEGTTTALLGDPGAGKSALLAAFASHLSDLDVPFLAIKADLIDPSVSDEEALAKAIGLDRPLTAILSEVATIRRVVLIVDQLDALATYIDLKTGRLNVLLNIVRRMGGNDNVHVVISSRTFEYEHDTRLKTVHAESLHLELPSWSTVLEILERNGVKAAGWPEDAQRLMRSPQTLKTFLSLIEAGGGDDFTNYQKLLDRLWRERILSTPAGGALASLVSKIAEDMAEHENLWVPNARYANEPLAIETLIAAGVLTDFGSDSKVGFTHQTLFEHALARSFAEEEGRLSSYVLSRQASLFVRPKMWAGLSYLRNVDPPTYSTEIQAIWNQPSLRRHLKFLLVEFMGSQTAPIETELTIMKLALSSQTRRVALGAIQGSPGWFARLQHTAIRDSMLSPEEIGIATMTLMRAMRFDNAGVIALMNSVWLQSAEYDGNVWAVLEDVPHWSDAELKIAETVIGRSAISDYPFEHTISVVGAEQPDIALKLTLARLKKQLKDAKAESAKRAANKTDGEDENSLANYLHASPSEPFHELLEKSDGYSTLDEIARLHPDLFLEILWPWFEQALADLREVRGQRDDVGYAVPYGVDPRFEEEESGRLGDNALLAAFTTSLVALGERDPLSLQAWIIKHKDADFLPAQRMFAHAVTVHAEALANFALEYLMEDTRRLHMGDIHDATGTTTRLITAASAHWSDAQIRAFTDYLQKYNPQPGDDREAKGRQRFMQAIDYRKLDVLRSLPNDRLPEDAAQRVAEGTRRFGERQIYSGVEARWIGSPMSADEMSKARDEEIVNAFTKLPDATEWDNPRDWMKGGNVQLSRELASFAKANPERGLRIIEKLDPEYGTRAAGYALADLGEVMEPDSYEACVLKLEARGFRGEEYRGSVARGLERILTRDLPLSDAMVNLLGSWLQKPAPAERPARTDEDEEESLLDTAKPDKKESREESVLWGMGGFSVLPHGNYPILEVLARVYLQRNESDALVELLQRHLAEAEDAKVWGAMLRFMQYIRPENPAKFETFLEELLQRYPELKTSREMAVLLAHLQRQIPAFVGRVLTDWEKHEAVKVQQARGEIAGLVAVVRPEQKWAGYIVDRIIERGPPSALTGLAYSAVNVWPDEQRRGPALSILKRIIPIADDRTWSAVTDVFRIVDDITPSPEWIDLLGAIAPCIEKHSPVQSTFVVDRLQTLLPDGAELVARIATALVRTWKGELGDMRTATASTAAELVDISITLHRLGPATRELGTDLFEDLLEVNAYTARETLDQIDNRFRGAAPAQRRRLPRRARRAPRLRRAQ